MFQFLDKTRILGNDLINDAVNFLIKRYKQSIKIFSYSTSYGQLMLVVNNVWQLLLYYIKESTDQTNFITANRPETIAGLAQLQGHFASKGISAIGEVNLKLKSGVTTSTIIGNKVFIPNYLAIKFKNNNLDYFLELGSDYKEIDLTSNKDNLVRIVQGEYESQEFQGTGNALQSFEVEIDSNKQVDEKFLQVFVNGERYDRYESLIDIPYQNSGYLLKNTLNGMAVVFGKPINHKVPEPGSLIVVSYVKTDGSNGNSDEIKNATWTFSETGFDLNGNEVNLDQVLSITTTLPPSLGADQEDSSLTKVIAPNVSRSFFIHDKNSIEYYFGKMNFFSTIKVFRDELDNVNTYKVLLIPDVNKRLNSAEDYFNADVTKFFLKDYEKIRILNAVQEGGQKSANIQLSLLNPQVHYFSMTVICDVFQFFKNRPVDLAQVESRIRKVLSDYYLANKRLNKIPHSDIVRILDNIDEIDSVKVVFHPEFASDIDNYGNINLNDDSVAVCRGGFVDEQGVEYFDKYDPNDNSMGSVNTMLNFISTKNNF